MSFRWVFVLGAVIFAQTGCYYVSVDLDELQTSVQSAQLSISHADMVVGVPFSVTTSVDVDIAEELGPEIFDVLTSVRITDLALIPGNRIENFDFLKRAVVRVKHGDLPELTISKPDRPIEHAIEGALVVPIDSEVDTTEYFKGKTHFHFDLEGTVPATVWDFGLEIGLSVRAETWERVL